MVPLFSQPNMHGQHDMKIGICANHYYPSVGGVEIITQQLAEYLAKDHEVFVITRRLAQKRDHSLFSYPVFEYRVGDSPWFENRVKTLSLDYLLVYSDVFDFFRQAITMKSNCKLILCLCGGNWLFSHRNFLNALYQNRYIQNIVCNSKCEREYRLCDNDRLLNKTVVIPNGVNTQEFDTNSLSRDVLDPDIKDRRWILNVSNFFPGKGQEHLIKILDLLPNQHELAYIQIANDIDFAIGKQLESKWKIAAREAEKKGSVIRLKKNLPREEVIGFFKQSNAFAFTSEKEVAPLVLLEAMASKLPWVATNIGNAQELSGGICIHTIKDSRAYSVFDRRVIVQFADAIQRATNNNDLGSIGREQIDKSLTWEKILPQYAQLFHS